MTNKKDQEFTWRGEIKEFTIDTFNSHNNNSPSKVLTDAFVTLETLKAQNARLTEFVKMCKEFGVVDATDSFNFKNRIEQLLKELKDANQIE